MEHIHGITYRPISSVFISEFKNSFGNGQGRNEIAVSWFYDKVKPVLECTFYFTAILPQIYEKRNVL